MGKGPLNQLRTLCYFNHQNLNILIENSDHNPSLLNLWFPYFHPEHEKFNYPLDLMGCPQMTSRSLWQFLTSPPPIDTLFSDKALVLLSQNPWDPLPPMAVTSFMDGPSYILLGQGSLTQMYRRATFQRKNAPRAAVYYKKAFASHNLQVKLSN